MTQDPIDQKWLAALTDLYPISCATLPFYMGVDGTVNAARTLTKFFELIDLKIDPLTGRIADPNEHNAEPDVR